MSEKWTCDCGTAGREHWEFCPKCGKPRPEPEMPGELWVWNKVINENSLSDAYRQAYDEKTLYPNHHTRYIRADSMCNVTIHVDPRTGKCECVACRASWFPGDNESLSFCPGCRGSIIPAPDSEKEDKPDVDDSKELATKLAKPDAEYKCPVCGGEMKLARASSTQDGVCNWYCPSRDHDLNTICRYTEAEALADVQAIQERTVTLGRDDAEEWYCTTCQKTGIFNEDTHCPGCGGKIVRKGG